METDDSLNGHHRMINHGGRDLHDLRVLRALRALRVLRVRRVRDDDDDFLDDGDDFRDGYAWSDFKKDNRSDV